MNKKLILIVGVIVIILLVVILNNTKGDDVDPIEVEQSIITNNDTSEVEEIAPIEAEQSITTNNDSVEVKQPVPTNNAQLAGAYETYSPEKITQAEENNILLFFHATWCPSCRTLNSDIEKNKNNIPANTLILKVDYDKEGELKKKYGVTTQHTIVQVDKSGAMIKKWSGGSTLQSVISKI